MYVQKHTNWSKQGGGRDVGDRHRCIPRVPDGPHQQNSTCWCGEPKGVLCQGIMVAPLSPGSPLLVPSPLLQARKEGGTLAPAPHLVPSTPVGCF